MSRIVVTGASGRVGRMLVRQLRCRGDDVVGLDLRPNEELGVQATDLMDSRSLGTALDGAQKVAHLAAFMSWNPDHSESIVQTNVMTTYNLMKAAHDAGVSRVVMGSSGEVYPEGVPKCIPLDERHPTEPRSPYGLSKLLAEQVGRFWARTTTLQVLILRFSHTQDAAELADPDSPMSGPRFFLAAKASQQEAFGNKVFAAQLRELDAGRNRMYVATAPDGTPFRMGICETRDLVGGIILGLDTDGLSGEAIGIGPDRAASFDEVVDPIATALGREVIRVPMPGTPVNYETSNDKAKRLLGFTSEWPIDRMVQEAIKSATK